MAKVDVGGVELHYEQQGSGPAVLLVAGLTLDGGVWADVASVLARDFRVVTADNRGAGRSAAPRGPYTVPLLAGDLYGLSTILGLEQVVVVGHSFGGYLALQLALDSPELVAGLALLATAATGREELLGSSPEAHQALTRVQGPLEEIIRQYLEVGFAPEFRREHRDRLERFVASRLASPPSGRGVAGQRAAAARFDVRQRLWEIGCPALVVHGTADEIVSLERGQELAQGIGGARIELLPGKGHMLQIEAPRKLAELIRGFSLSLAKGAA